MLVPIRLGSKQRFGHILDAKETMEIVGVGDLAHDRQIQTPSIRRGVKPFPSNTTQGADLDLHSIAR